MNENDYGINVLSAFDGMSCGQLALERAGIKVNNYYASQVDKFAIAVTQYRYPDTVQLGDINNFEEWDLPKIDLLMGGSPCQGFSFAGKQLNFEDPRSKLFFKFVDILNKFKPKYFLLENVRMKKEYQDVISGLLGVEPIIINSSLVSAQNRVRLYWTNIPNVTQPEDKGLVLKDIIENGEVSVKKSQTIKSQYAKNSKANFEHNGGSFHATGVRCIQVGNADLKGRNSIRAVYSPEGKSPTLITPTGGNHEAKIVLENSKCIQVGKADLKGHDYLKRVYSPEGKSPTLNANGGGNLEPKIVIIPQDVNVRKYEVDVPNLQNLLITHKNNVGMSTKQISEKLNIEKTKVEHWFRRDKYFAIPDKDIWLKLKEVLNINIDTFDKSILEWETKEGVFEMSNRVYNPNYKCPTLITANTPKIICGASRGRYVDKDKTSTRQMIEIRKDEKTNTITSVQKDNLVVYLDEHKSKNGLICLAGINKNKRWLNDGKTLQRNFSQGERIYSSQGKSPCLSANSGGTAGPGSALVNNEHNQYNGTYLDGETRMQWRKLTPLECERLQTVPDNYTLVPYGKKMMSNSQRYKMLGNGWTVDVIAHIFRNMK